MLDPLWLHPSLPQGFPDDLSYSAWILKILLRRLDHAFQKCHVFRSHSRHREIGADLLFREIRVKLADRCIQKGSGQAFDIRKRKLCVLSCIDAGGYRVVDLLPVVGRDAEAAAHRL